MTVVSPKVAAKRFGVTTRAITHWVAQGRLPSINTPGGHARIPEEVLPEAKKVRWIKTGEVARMLKMSHETVRRRARAGLLPSFLTLGGHLRFDRVQIAQIAEHR